MAQDRARSDPGARERPVPPAISRPSARMDAAQRRPVGRARGRQEQHHSVRQRTGVGAPRHAMVGAPLEEIAMFRRAFIVAAFILVAPFAANAQSTDLIVEKKTFEVASYMTA